MLRRLAFLTVFCISSAPAGILTDNLGTAKRVTLETPAVPDKPVWDEYGLDGVETGRYESAGGKSFTATAWRLKDPTGSQAAFRWLRPAGAQPGNKDALFYSPRFAVTTGPTTLMTFGNYLLRFDGGVPVRDELKILLFQLPRVDQSSLPPVIDYIPGNSLVSGTDRFIAGPASLEKFFPELTPAAVGFHFGAEGVVGRYRMGSSETEMAVFYYPTNQMARDRLPEFRKLSGALVKRSGPILALVSSPRNANDAERLLALVNYRAQVTTSARPTTIIQDTGSMLIAIFQLIGVLLSITIVAGVMVFFMRRLRRAAAGGKEEDPMTMLHLEDRH
ncbi:MAG: hypothetical protein IT165_21020 [Bryobacterales bacterium]|nr:hypothetical protein [Bryobacterales bacterium]